MSHINQTSVSRKIFVVFNYIGFTLFSLIIILPFLNAIAMSLSDYNSVFYGRVYFWPVGFNIEGYKEILTSKNFVYIFLNTAGLTTLNTFLVITLALAAGYVLGNKHMIGSKVLMNYILIPMYFSGGLIPYYLTINNLGLNDTYGALILPAIVNTFYIIVFRNSIAAVPAELSESAELDGAGDFVILFRIILPIIMPMVTAFVIFSAVAYWNEWYNVMLFINDTKKWTLQYWLRDILVTHRGGDSMINPVELDPNLIRINPRSREMAAIMITILPITIVYPFLQKYFIHGIIVGAVKG